MPRYTEDYLYNEFSQLAGMRSDPKYANDATYWTGGNCNWGGNHNLREDCATIAKSFAKMESLDGEKIKAELNKCTSQSEYESKKQDYIRKANELANGFQVRTGHSSSMFGICIIWADYAMNPFVENKLKDCRRGLENLRGQIGGEKYQYVEELRILKLERNQIEARMKENKRKAQAEKDPAKKAALLLLIEEDGKRLEANLRKQQAIPKSGINFDPKQHVDDFIDSIRRALQGKSGGSGGGNGSGGNRNKNRSGDNNGNGGSNGGDGNDNQNPNKPPRQRRQEKKDKDNSQMILIAVAVIVILFLMMNQKEKPSREYDEFDYY